MKPEHFTEGPLASCRDCRYRTYVGMRYVPLWCSLHEFQICRDGSDLSSCICKSFEEGANNLNDPAVLKTIADAYQRRKLNEND